MLTLRVKIYRRQNSTNKAQHVFPDHVLLGRADRKDGLTRSLRNLEALLFSRAQKP